MYSKTDQNRNAFIFFGSSTTTEECTNRLESHDFDGLILRVSAADGPMPITRDLVNATASSGIDDVLIYLDNVDLVDDEELLELVGLEARELLSKFDLDGDGAMIVYDTVFLGMLLDAIDEAFGVV